MFCDGRKLNIVIGAYGSGKSEIAVNMALAMHEGSPRSKILIADLDIVNPFYRSSDCAAELEAAGIRVVSPTYAGSNVDAPVLPAEMYAIFDDDEYSGVFDIGGEDMGAVVLGSMKQRIASTEHKIFMAVNTLRPFTSDVPQIVEMTRELEQASGFKVDAYLNNTNLLEQTTADMVLEGEQMVLEASAQTGIPLAATCVMKDAVSEEVRSGVRADELFEMRRLIRYTY